MRGWVFVKLPEEPLPSLPVLWKESNAEQLYSPDPSPSHGAAFPCSGANAVMTVPAATAASSGNGMKLRGWEKRILSKQLHSPLLHRKPGSYSCTAHRQNGSKDKAHLHVLCYMTLIVRYDSGRFTLDIVLKSLQESSSAKHCPIKHAASC